LMTARSVAMLVRRSDRKREQPFYPEQF